MYEIILVLVALLPAIVLCCYVYRKDRVEKEPIGFLLLLMLLGALTAFPVVMVSEPVNYLIDGFFSLFAERTGSGLYLDDIPYSIYLFVSNTVGVACIEEGFKWLVLFFVTRKSKHFNSYFDGLIYAVFVSLGFAAFENILYTFDYGFSTALVRAFTAVPGHMFDGVIMGTFYSMWNIKNEAAKLENEFRKKGIIKVRKPISGRSELILSYVLPVLAHGAYDYLCSESSWLSSVLFGALLAVLYITQFKRISQMSREDAGEIGYAISLVCKKHPAVKALIDAAMNNMPESASYVKTASAGIRQTHRFNDFEFSIPAPPSGEPVDGNTPKPGADPSSYTTDGQEKPFKIFVDESQD